MEKRLTDKDQNQKTRIAFVDPESGRLIAYSDSEDQPRIRSEEVDATIVANETPVNQVARFVPKSGMREAGEATSIWAPKKWFGRVELKNKNACYKKPTRRPSVFRISALLITTIAVGLYAFANRNVDGGSLSRSQSPEVLHRDEVGSFSSPPLRAVRILVTKPPPTPLVPLSKTDRLETSLVPPRLVDAVDAILEGRLKEAEQIYLRLAQAYPDERSYAIAADILKRTQGRSTP
jgi:hypothetical protein